MREETNIKESKYYRKLDEGKVQCTLCPRNCILNNNQRGFCKVRQNIGGNIFNLYYGLTTYMVVEPIETNGIFHYHPGERALSIGSIGCNLDCEYCQAWRYSRVENVNLNYFKHYSPEDIVHKVEELGLRIIAWTFNDPMSCLEFVLDTARIAKKKGIVCIFKSNHFINEASLRDIAKYVDIFSISLKSINNVFYKKICSGWIEPVLDAAIILKQLDKHIEVSNLVIPTLNNSKNDFLELSKWVKNNLGSETPLHFARFHPDYKLKNLPRTPIEDIQLARNIAKEQGIKYVYSGNVFIDNGLNTYCPKCGNTLIERRGERTWTHNHNKKKCDNCGTAHNIKFSNGQLEDQIILKIYEWKKDIWAIHIQIINNADREEQVILNHQFNNCGSINDVHIEIIKVASHEEIRYAICRINVNHLRTKISFSKEVDITLYNNLDRAYYSLGE